jgi:hypothetical protein
LAMTAFIIHKRQIADEDKLIVEEQHRTLARTGESNLVDIASDRARVHMRRIVQRLENTGS